MVTKKFGTPYKWGPALYESGQNSDKHMKNSLQISYLQKCLWKHFSRMVAGSWRILL